MKFLNLPGFFIPVIAGLLLADFTPFEYRALGAAIGIIFLYVSIGILRK